MAKGKSGHRDLLDAIREATGNDAIAWAHEPEHLDGGFWAEVLRIRLSHAPGLEGDLVARILPEPRTWEREMTAQTFAADHGFSTPRVRLGSPPTKKFGCAWIVMDFARGKKLMATAPTVAFAKSIPRMLKELPPMLVGRMVALHAIDASPIASKMGPPRTVGPSLEWLYSRAAEAGDQTLMKRAERLIGTRPPYRRSVLCHGDLHSRNVIRGPEGDMVVDWKYAQCDDPLYDVAWTRLMFETFPARLLGKWRPGVFSIGKVFSRRLVTQYELATGQRIDPHRLQWFTDLSVLRILVEVEDWKRSGRLDRGFEHPYIPMAEFLRRTPY